MNVLNDAVFSVTTPGGIVKATLNELLDFSEQRAVHDFPRAHAHMRPGIRTMLGSLLALRRAYGDLNTLGEDLWRLSAPHDEPAFFQSPSGLAELSPVSLGDVGPILRGPDHVIKPTSETDDPEPWLWELITATMRPFARYPSGLRAGVVNACPTDGTIGSEIVAVANATDVDVSGDARDHLVWHRPRGKGLEPNIAELPAPVLDAPRIIRLVSDSGRWRALAAGGTAADMRCLTKDSNVIDPTSGRTIDKSGVKPLRAFGVPLGAFDVVRVTAGVKVSKTMETLPAQILARPTGLPFLIVDALAGGQGGSEGYRAKLFPLGKRSRLRLGGPDAKSLAADILAAQRTAHWCLQTALAASGAVREDTSKAVVGGIRTAVAGLNDLDGEAGWRGADLLFDLLNLDLAADEEAHRIHLTMRDVTVAQWERILPALDAVAMGKAEATLHRTMNAKLPLKREVTPDAAA